MGWKIRVSLMSINTSSTLHYALILIESVTTTLAQKEAIRGCNRSNRKLLRFDYEKGCWVFWGVLAERRLLW